jgi:Tat protein translocase TatB subunit
VPQIGPLEILVVSVIALVVFGPRRLPEIARSIGRAVNEFRRQANDIRAEFESGLSVEDESSEPTRPNEPYVHKVTTQPEESSRQDDTTTASEVSGEQKVEPSPGTDEDRGDRPA